MEEEARKKRAATSRPKQGEGGSASLVSPNATPGVVLLSGGNPQIAKGYGDAPVQAYIAAMPGWKSDLGRRLDALVEQALPHVSKAVKWNTPFYGVESGRWFLAFHCFAKYVKLTFFDGALLNPVPPEKSKQERVRYLNIREGDFLDEQQFLDWVQQASSLPGERL